MRFLLFIILIVHTGTRALSQGIDFYEGTFQSLLDEAKKQNKLIFVDCYTTWCGPCTWMSKNVFTNKSVGEFYNKNFINYKSDMEKGEGKEIRKTYFVNAFPTLLYLNSSGEIENRSVGACDTNEFIKIGKNTTAGENTFGTLLRKYKNGDRSPEFLARYVIACYNVRYPYDINEYFTALPDSSLLNETNFNIIEKYTGDVKSREFTFLIKNREIYSQLVGSARVENKIIDLLKKQLFLLSAQKLGKTPENALSEIFNTLNLADTLVLKTKVLLEYYSSGKFFNQREYERNASGLMKIVKLQDINTHGLSDIIKNIAYNSTDTCILKEAPAWCGELLKRDSENPSYYFYTAKIYEKTGDIVKAKDFASKAMAEEKKKPNPRIDEYQNFIDKTGQKDSKK